MRTFTSQERAVLRALQSDLPDSTTPYADIAAEAGVDEAVVLELVRALREDGVIRRFGASIKHQKTGWDANVMVAWQVEETDADAMGAGAARHAHVSHCYFRPSSDPDWPYTLYTMVHGRSREECEAVVEALRAGGLPEDYAMLDSVREMKKISMTYF